MKRGRDSKGSRNLQGKSGKLPELVSCVKWTYEHSSVLFNCHHGPTGGEGATINIVINDGLNGKVFLCEKRKIMEILLVTVTLLDYWRLTCSNNRNSLGNIYLNLFIQAGRNASSMSITWQGLTSIKNVYYTSTVNGITRMSSC